QPVAQPTAKVEKAQRPDIRLPVDVIKGVKQGGARPPLSQLAQSQAAAQPPKPGDRARSKSPLGQGGGQARGGGGGGGPKPGPMPPSETPLGKAVRKHAKTGTGTGGKDTPEGEHRLAGMANARIDRQKSRQVPKVVKVGPDGQVIDEEEGGAARRTRRLTR